MLSKSFKTIYNTETGEEISTPVKVAVYYHNGTEITESEYNALLDKLPKPKQPTEQEIANLQEIENLKQQLAETDYKAIKYAEGWLSEEEYAPVKAQRQALRNRIRELENETH